MIFVILYFLLGLGCWILFTLGALRFMDMDPNEGLDLIMAVGIGLIASLIWPLVLVAVGVAYAATLLANRQRKTW